MTRYEWTPASEPPSDYRYVQGWLKTEVRCDPQWADVQYFGDGVYTYAITHWRDVEPPKGEK